MYVTSPEASEGAPANSQQLGKVYVINGHSNKVKATVNVVDAASVAVDARSDRIYVDETGYEVMAINGHTNKVIATSPNDVFYPTGLAANPRTDTVYSSGGDGAVAGMWALNGSKDTVIGGATGLPIVETAPEVPSGVAVDPATGTEFITDAGNAGFVVAAIHGLSKKAASTTLLAAYNFDPTSYGIAVNPATDTIYAVGNEGNCPGAVWAISTVTHKASIVAAINDPGALAVDPSSNSLYVTASDKLFVLKGSLRAAKNQAPSCGGGGGGITLGG